MTIKNKPRVFIGSSSEGLPAAEAIQEHLVPVCHPFIWTQGVFGIGEVTLDSLLSVADKADYAILVMTPDDTVNKRELTAPCPRDNVVFEFGLFMGKLGRKKCFAVVEQTASAALPSDLAGLTTARYAKPENEDEYLISLAPACTKIKRAIGQAAGQYNGTVPPEKAKMLLGEWDMIVQRVDPPMDRPEKTLSITFQLEDGQLVGSFFDADPNYEKWPGHDCKVECDFVPGNYFVFTARPTNDAIDKVGLFIVKGNQDCSMFNGKIVGLSTSTGTIVSENVSFRRPENSK